MAEVKKYPSHIPCSICKAEKFVRQDVFEARLKIFGTVENLMTKYICRSCRVAEGVTATGEKKPPKAKKERTPHEQHRHYQDWKAYKQRTAMELVMEEDPFDKIRKPFWLTKAFRDNVAFYELSKMKGITDDEVQQGLPFFKLRHLLGG